MKTIRNEVTPGGLKKELAFSGRLQVLITLLLILVMTSCSNRAEPLVGTWRSAPRETEFGRLGMIFEFRANGELRIASYTPGLTNEMMRSTGSYTVEGSRILSKEFIEAGAVTFWFEDDYLMIKYMNEPVYRLQRQ